MNKQVVDRKEEISQDNIQSQHGNAVYYICVLTVKADASSSNTFPVREMGTDSRTNIIFYTEVHTMVVQHNMSAMNANRMLSGVSSAQSNQQRSYHQVTELTVQQMMQQDFLSQRR